MGSVKVGRDIDQSIVVFSRPARRARAGTHGPYSSQNGSALRRRGRSSPGSPPFNLHVRLSLDIW